MIFRYLTALTAVLFLSADATAADGVRYNRDVRPILADACFRCHGSGVKKAGVRLDARSYATKTTETGVIPIVPGKPETSEVVRRIFAEDDEAMPPLSTHKPLTPEQKATLKQWVASGAVYEPHWAFVRPEKVALPTGASTNENPIDAFINDRLRREGLKPSAEADRETLIRRASFALTGLPPTPAEVDLFTGDSSTKAYENMVERYLFSPRFGEEMARHWLDVARYADTHGLHLDNERQMWLYRDWVVKAFNDNMPFDQFTREQLAGDLLPNATPDQLIATGFNRCNVTTGEGGSIETEWIFRNAIDRTSTMSETWMGLTAGCAVCHDHKFDPIRAEDFYSLYSFFYSAAGPALDGNVLAHEPFLKRSTAEQDRKIADLSKQIEVARKEIDRKAESLSYTDPVAVPKSIEKETPKNPIGPPATLAGDPFQSLRAWSAQGNGPFAKNAPAEIKTLLTQSKSGKLPPAGEKQLRTYYLQHVCKSTKEKFKPGLDKIAASTKQLTALQDAIPGSLVFKETDKPRDTFVMLRGQYDKPGKKVEPNTPAFLPALKKANPSGRATRLDLADWLVGPENPLTARVAVNRLWQQFFGTGLVKTSFDFGTQGEPPSHPELLDRLAIDFRESGWDVRRFVRLILNSSTFRQSTKVTPELLKRDPENRLYARGPRFRLDAEQVRDNALFVGGLIDLRMSGRGVKPYQPTNIWEPVAFTGSNTRSYQQDHGSSLYRRSLYAFLKRTAPPPFMANFDAPSREFFCARRERSNTPLQALQLMNDVQQFEAARSLAGRMMVEGGSSPQERIGFGFRVVLSRSPEPDELAVLHQEWKAYADRYVHDASSASRIVHVGESPAKPGLSDPELAAYTLVANTLLNLDETVTRN